MTVITQVSLITTGVHMGQIGTLVDSLIMMNNLVQPCTEVMTKTMIHMIVMHGMILNVQIKWKLFVKLRSTAIPQHHSISAPSWAYATVGIPGGYQNPGNLL